MTEINTDNNQPPSLAEASRGGPSPAQRMKKVLIFVVCYNAERSIEAVLDRIPRDLLENKDFYAEVLIIDNHSLDRTFYAASGYASSRPQLKVTVLYNPKSQGYGANQKIGFRYAIEHGFDAVVLLHGDNRYA
ncbi:MAG: glycosyltransferase, partial [Sedimentisphaerales bacterium]|nr:glycosyltransferase [Sedimentisphaerales bacterium]